MKKHAAAPSFDIYFRASYQKTKKRSGMHKKRLVTARSKHRKKHAVGVWDIKDDEMPEPPVTPKDERKIWD